MVSFKRRALAISLGIAISAMGIVSAASSACAGSEAPIWGEYSGLYADKEGHTALASGKIIAEGEEKYRAVLSAKTTPPLTIELQRDTAEQGAFFVSANGSGSWRGKVDKNMLTLVQPGGGRFQLVRTERRSPTEGLAPPPGAIVLLPYERGKPTNLDAWKNKRWKCLPDGSVQVFQGGNRSVREHGSGLFHIEFKVPFQPEARGQGRGNSGVYFESRYEIQVLDSFGLTPGMGDCGSIYGIAITKENACLPPLAWQTYDVIYCAPRKGPDGKLTPAMMTVFHNGVKIHENQPVSKTTTASPEKENAERGPLFLQDHGNPVCYRNIWYMELED